MNRTLTDQAFAAWQTGEQSGDYTAFRALLGSSFQHFSHPLRGRFTGPDALAELGRLIQEREQTPNALTFSAVQVSEGPSRVLYQFDSMGTVSGQFAYAGYNIIAFEVQGEQLTGMAEYFGFVDPTWFA